MMESITDHDSDLFEQFTTEDEIQRVSDDLGRDVYKVNITQQMKMWAAEDAFESNTDSRDRYESKDHSQRGKLAEAVFGKLLEAKGINFKYIDNCRADFWLKDPDLIIDVKARQNEQGWRDLQVAAVKADWNGNQKRKKASDYAAVFVQIIIDSSSEFAKVAGYTTRKSVIDEETLHEGYKPFKRVDYSDLRELKF